MTNIIEFYKDGLKYHHTMDENPDPSAYIMHAHNNCELYYFISGNGVYMVENSAYKLRPGCVILVRPGEVHKLKVETDAPYERVVFSFQEHIFDGSRFETLLQPFSERQLGIGNQYLPEEYDSEFVRQCLNRFETAGTGEAGSAIIATTLLSILGEIYRSYLRRIAADDEGGETEPGRIRKIIDYVNEHITDDISLDSICEHFYISKTQLGRLFRRATGFTVWDYILVKRLTEARRQILSGIAVNKASANCGFGDYSAFYRAYCKRYEISPTADRHKMYSAL